MMKNMKSSLGSSFPPASTISGDEPGSARLAVPIFFFGKASFVDTTHGCLALTLVSLRDGGNDCPNNGCYEHGRCEDCTKHHGYPDDYAAGSLSAISHFLSGFLSTKKTWPLISIFAAYPSLIHVLLKYFHVHTPCPIAPRLPPYLHPRQKSQHLQTRQHGEYTGFLPSKKCEFDGHYYRKSVPARKRC